MSTLTLQVLGSFHVRDGSGSEIRIASRKGRALLAYLALRPGESHGRERLANLLWQDADEELARTSLRQALAALRKALPASAQGALLADAESVGIDSTLLNSDIQAFRRSLLDGTRASLQEAIDQYRGELLDGFDARSSAFEEWLNSERCSLRKQMSEALHRLTELCVAAEDNDGALSASLRLISLEPLNESAHRRIMQLQARRNAYAEALHQYRVCRDVLRRELDVAPETATENLYRALMSKRCAAGDGHMDAHEQFVGRRPELAMIVAPLDGCMTTRHGRAIVVRGAAGIGKTRLVDAVRSAAIERGVGVHSAQVFDFGQSLGRRPITVLALSLLGIRPDASAAERKSAVQRMAAVRSSGIEQSIFLSDLIDAPLDAELAAIEKAMAVSTRQRGRTLALAHIIESAAQRSPQLLVVEDVHWADSDELARLGEIAAVVANCQILFIMTTRPEGDPISASWRARARGCPVTTVDLAPLADDEAQELAAHHPELSEETSQACILRAEGSPLFLDQLLRFASTGQDELPVSMRSLVLSRAGRLSSQDRSALESASVLGQCFEPAIVRCMLQDEHYEPDRLIATTFVRSDVVALEFAHALFREAIYESIAKPQRRALHRAAADWFESRDLSLHAEHLAAAKDEGAAAAYLNAAQAARTALRYESASALANKASALAHEPILLHKTSVLLGELLLLLGRPHDALAAYREALDFAIDQNEHCTAWFGIASALRVMDRHDEALDALERAEKIQAAATPPDKLP